MRWGVLILLSLFGILEAVQLPPEIQKCSLSDPKITECLAKSMTRAIKYFKDGSKDFGFPIMEPLKMTKIEIESEPGKSVALNQVYEDVKMHGLSESKVVKVSRSSNDKTCHWEIDVHTPMSRMEADYKLTGQILVFPINGFGKCNVTLYNIVNHHTVDCETYTKKGKLHQKFKNYQMNMNVDKCEFNFDNIFPGNEQISNELTKTINENSLEIFKEVKSGFEKILSTLHENIANNVFSRIPLDELFEP